MKQALTVVAMVALLLGSLVFPPVSNADERSESARGNSRLGGHESILFGHADGMDPMTTRLEAEGEFELGKTVVHEPQGTAASRSRFKGALPRMEQRYVTDSDPLGQNFGAIEPTSGFAPDGTAFYISGGDGEDLRPRVFSSSDNGATWANVSPRYVPGQTPRASGLDEGPPITGDPYLHVDPETGRIFSYNQSAYLFCDGWDISDDGGKTWDSWDTCEEEYSFGDHPTITTGRPRVSEMDGYPNIVYFCAAGETTFCRTSLDGGKTFGEPVEAMDKGEPQTGHVATAPDGTVYLPHVGANAAWVAVSRDDGRSWEAVQVDDTAWTRPNKYNSPNPEFPENNHDASVAVDSAGNAYFFWLGDESLPYLSVSRDAGKTWSSPVRVEAPGVTAANFQEIVAGRPGQIAFLYVGTTVPGGFEAKPADYEEAEWNGYVGFSVNALSPRPIFATATANPLSDPLRRGDCANRCWVNRGLTGKGELRDGMYDFLDIDVNPETGAVWVSLVDLCNNECGGRPGPSEDNGQYAMATVSVQTRGIRIGPAKGLHWR